MFGEKMFGMFCAVPDDSVDGDPFHHGLLHVKVAGVHILELHMSPNNSTQRQAEAALISNIVKGATGSVGAGEPLVVLGDFNNLSPVDSQRHVDQGIAEHMRKVSLGCRVELGFWWGLHLNGFFVPDADRYLRNSRCQPEPRTGSRGQACQELACLDKRAHL
jgi:hypothetical protein